MEADTRGVPLGNLKDVPDKEMPGLGATREAHPIVAGRTHGVVPEDDPCAAVCKIHCSMDADACGMFLEC
jgi:hypothetical protein